VIGRLLRAWDRFLLEPVSPVPIAVYRILFGTLVFVNGLLLLPDVAIFFGEQGVLPMDAALRYTRTPRLNVLAWLPNDERWLYGFFAIYLGASVCLAAGVLTRFSAALVFVSLATLHHRNMVVLNSADTFLRVASFCLIFSAAGRALSVDRWLRVRRGLEPPGGPPPAAPWAQRLIQIQLAIAYLATVRWKLAGHTWVDGTAVYYATRLHEFWRFPVPYVFDHLWTIKLMTWGTLAVEVALGTLVWFRRLRYPVLLAGLLLHLGLEYSMNIQLFQWVMISTYVLFVEERDLRRALAWLSRLAGVGSREIAAGDPSVGNAPSG
jgi:uncharacterized membrane protein YphA (DoxX/SURF4 family)